MPSTFQHLTFGKFSNNLQGNQMCRRRDRMPRAVAIVAYTNEQLMSRYVSGTTCTNGTMNCWESMTSGLQKVRQWRIHYGKRIRKSDQLRNRNSIGTGCKLRKQMENGNHLAGHTIIQPDGKRYVYGLPAYNHTQVQETFSVPVQDGSFSTTSFDVEPTADGPRLKI